MVLFYNQIDAILLILLKFLKIFSKFLTLANYKLFNPLKNLQIHTFYNAYPKIM
jgi:hypothetical protein